MYFLERKKDKVIDNVIAVRKMKIKIATIFIGGTKNNSNDRKHASIVAMIAFTI